MARDKYAALGSPYFQVVIKALNPYLQEDVDEALIKTLVENFEIEARILDAVRHPNIVSRLGHGTSRDRNNRYFHYLILEYLPGGDLSKLCRPNGLALHRVLYYLEQVCAGLMKAHEKGIIHRDIKPQNLLLTADRETVKIADFGVARFAENVAPITRVGTNLYAPPEHSPINQNASSDGKLTPASDIYSLAKTTYVLLTGKAPREFILRPITSLPEEFSKESTNLKLLEILEKATQDNPSDRYQTVQEFWTDLARLCRMNTQTVALTANLIPSQRVSAGYTDTIPEIARFETVYDMNKTASLEGAAEPIAIHQLKSYEEENKQPILAKIAKAIVFLAIFAVALFAVQLYLKTIFPVSRETQSLTKVEGIAMTDVNIRPSPGTREAPVGVVPKGSKVRIIRSQDNWYEIDVIEYSRPKRDKNDADRGWVNGKYIEIKSDS